MAETSNRNSDTVAKTIPYALAGIGMHILDHQLPIPMSVGLPSAHLDNTDAIQVHVMRYEAEAWRASIAVDETVERPHAPGSVAHIAIGRLPGTGVRVHVMHLESARLSAVTA